MNFFMTFCIRLNKYGRRLISSLTRTASADSTAMSEPIPPMAIPASAAVRASASLTPSPTIQTGSFPPEYSLIMFIFSSGKRFACTSSIPAFSAMAAAAYTLSPVRSMGVIPTAFSLSSVSFASSRSVSRRAIKPISCLSAAR